MIKKVMVVIALIVLTSIPASAGYLAIQNSTFESPALPNMGNWSYTVDGWDTQSMDGNPNHSGGVWYAVTSEYDDPIPEGNQVGFIYYPSMMQQELDDVLEPETTYTLSVWVGHRETEWTDSYLIELLVGNNTIASIANYDPGYGSWDLLKMEYNSSDADASLFGQNLGIRFRNWSNYGQVQFDDVKLFANSNPVPLPGTILLFGSSLSAIGILRKIRRRQR